MAIAKNNKAVPKKPKTVSAEKRFFYLQFHNIQRLRKPNENNLLLFRKPLIFLPFIKRCTSI